MEQIIENMSNDEALAYLQKLRANLKETGEVDIEINPLEQQDGMLRLLEDIKQVQASEESNTHGK